LMALIFLCFRNIRAVVLRIWLIWCYYRHILVSHIMELVWSTIRSRIKRKICMLTLRNFVNQYKI
jgi:hypothetical protein